MITAIPEVLQGKTTDEKIREILDYLYQFNEQLRYTLNNIGKGNFNDAELDTILSGLVTVQDLQTGGKTQISGDNITSGTIRAANLEGCTFTSNLQESGAVGGQIVMKYMDNTVGGIRLDDQGEGSDDETKYRMFIHTGTAGGKPFAMKMESDGGISIETQKNIFMYAVEPIVIRAPEIRITGKLIVNGREIT